MAKSRRYIDGDVQAAIEELAQDQPSWTAAQVLRELEKRPYLQGRLPTLRTVQTIVKEVRPADPSGPWSLIDATGEEAALVLPVLAAVVEETALEVVGVTKREAAWIVKLRTAAHDLPLLTTYYLARQYMVREDRKEPCAPLDVALAFAPWRCDNVGRDISGTPVRSTRLLQRVFTAVHQLGRDLELANSGRSPHPISWDEVRRRLIDAGLPLEHQEVSAATQAHTDQRNERTTEGDGDAQARQ